MNIDIKKIESIIDDKIEIFLNNFESKYIKEKDNPDGVINMKKIIALYQN